MANNNNQGNQQLQQILLDLSLVLNPSFIRRSSRGDEEISAATKRLGGLLVQPSSINSKQFDVTRSYFRNLGATEEAATNLSMLVANISKITGISMLQIAQEIDQSNGIVFSDDTYSTLNNLRNKESQWFKSIPTENDRSFYRLPPRDVVCPPPEDFQVNCYCEQPINVQVCYCGDDFLTFTSQQTPSNNLESDLGTFVFIEYLSLVNNKTEVQTLNYGYIPFTTYKAIVRLVTSVVSDYKTITKTAYISEVNPDYEYMVLSDNGSVYNLTYDYKSDVYTIHSVVGPYVSGIAGDEDFYVTTGLSIYVWRGNCMSKINTVNPSTISATENMCLLEGEDKLIFSRPLEEHTLPSGPPWELWDNGIRYDFGLPGTQDWWISPWDYCHNNKGLKERGDTVVLSPNTKTGPTYPCSLALCSRDGGGSLVLEDYIVTYAAGSFQGGGLNRETGYGVLGAGTTGTGQLYPFRVKSDLTLEMLSPVTISTTDTVVAFTMTDHNHIITAEDGGGNGYVRTYDLTGNRLDSATATGSFGGNTLSQISHVTGRIWFLAVSTGAGFTSVSADETGQITIHGRLPFGTSYSGLSGPRAVFLHHPMNVYPNGYAGIKSKLFEFWEMDEASGTRTGSMSGTELIEDGGTLPSVITPTGTAVYFDGTMALRTVPTSTPFETQSSANYSLTCEVTPDVSPPPATEAIWTRGRLNWATHVECYCALDSDGYFKFHIQGQDRVLGTGNYWTTVVANDVSVVSGQKYHVYVEYDSDNQTASIRVNNGVTHTELLSENWSHYIFASLYERSVLVGMYSGRSNKFIGSMDNLVWFWDKLSTAEQDFMYNDGNSRTFGDL
jgi:hypothetical protein